MAPPSLDSSSSSTDAPSPLLAGATVCHRCSTPSPPSAVSFSHSTGFCALQFTRCDTMRPCVHAAPPVGSVANAMEQLGASSARPENHAATSVGSAGMPSPLLPPPSLSIVRPPLPGTMVMVEAWLERAGGGIYA